MESPCSGNIKLSTPNFPVPSPQLACELTHKLTIGLTDPSNHTSSEAFSSPRLFFVPFFFAVMSSWSIFFSKKSCFLANISSVSRSRWTASWGVGAFPPFPPPPNNLPNNDIFLLNVNYNRFINRTQNAGTL